MSLCKNIKGYTRHHERVADFFSLLALVLLFAPIIVGLVYHAEILSWISRDLVLFTPLAIGVILLDIFLIFFFLNIGSARFAEEDDSCFHTFKGRRSGTGSVGQMFNSWLHHMEHVGKKHR